MKREEMFRIWDATQPKVEDVKLYLDRICGKTPLLLAWKEKDKLTFSYEIKKEAAFVGFIIEDTLFHSRSFTYQDMFDKNGKPFFNELKVGNILGWMENHKSIYHFTNETHPLKRSEAWLLELCCDKVKDTIDILDYHNLKVEDTAEDKLAFLTDDEAEVSCKRLIGSTRLSYFLETGGVFWFCTNIQK